MSVLKMIVNEEFPYLLDLLPSIYKPNGFMHPLDAKELGDYPNKGPNDAPNDKPNDGSNEDPNKISNEGSIDGPDNRGDLLKENYLRF